MHQALRREMGLGGAIVTGLGSILGTGAFVAIGVASGQWGDAVLVAVPIAGVVALFNGLSSAFLAGRFPVAGGTYEYGYRTLGRRPPPSALQPCSTSLGILASRPELRSWW